MGNGGKGVGIHLIIGLGETEEEAKDGAFMGETERNLEVLEKLIGCRRGVL